MALDPQRNHLPRVHGCFRYEIGKEFISSKETTLRRSVLNDIKVLEMFLLRLNPHQQDYADVHSHIEFYLSQLRCMKSILDMKHTSLLFDLPIE